MWLLCEWIALRALTPCLIFQCSISGTVSSKRVKVKRPICQELSKTNLISLLVTFCVVLIFSFLITNTFFHHLYFNTKIRAVFLMMICASNKILPFQERQTEKSPQHMFSLSHNPTLFCSPNKITIFVGLRALSFLFLFFSFRRAIQTGSWGQTGFPWNPALFPLSLYSDQGERKLHKNEVPCCLVDSFLPSYFFFVI